ncbi:MAG: FAD-binding oxidoreductase [Proteobacteria bacterium]|nr:MAG: FAD-binding oxidoreductase [Pseudomonadota bacterium]
MQSIKHYDIAIIGAGITGLSAAYHLSEAGHRICLSEDTSDESTTDLSAQMITGGFIDNYTRISQRHGAEYAKQAWTYSNHAFDETIAFAKAHDVPYKMGKRIRLIETEDEKSESLKAVEQLKQAGFESTFEDKLPAGASVLLGLQIDEPRAAWIEKTKLIEVLKSGLGKVPRIEFTKTIVREKNHFVITSDSSSTHAEVVILANHLGIRTLVPSLKEVLVPSQDQWVRFQTQNEAIIPFPVGTLLTWRHGHYWAQVERDNQLCMGGARFFRPLAGFEAAAPELSAKISTHLPEAWAKYFPSVKLQTLIDQKPGLDIRPSDEMPVIGPMFGESGLFIGAGFMGQGLSLGFKAGQSLANIVLGKPDKLPRFFWPERHRSLESSD